MNTPKRLLFIVTMVNLVVVALCFGAAASVDSYDVSDEVLVTEFVRLLREKDVEGLSEFLSPGFIIQRADGTYLDKEGYLANHAHVEEYVITEIVGRQAGDVRVIRYNLAAIESIDGIWITEDPMPRLSAFVWNGERWQMVAHANFLAISAGR